MTTEPRIIEALDVYVLIDEWKGKMGVTIREYYESGQEDGWIMKPSKRGIRLPVKHLPELIDHLTALRDEAVAAGLI